MKKKTQIEFRSGNKEISKPITVTLNYSTTYATLTSWEKKENEGILGKFQTLLINGARYKAINCKEEDISDPLDPFGGTLKLMVFEYEKLVAPKVNFNEPATKLESITAILVSQYPSSKGASDETIFSECYKRAKSLLSFIAMESSM